MSETGRRREILRSAERLLTRYGASKTTMADVAREARIGVGTVYLEFPSKEAIIEELSTARHAALLDAMRCAAASGPTYRERLARVFEARTALLLGFADEGAHTCELVLCMSAAVKAAQARYAHDELALVCRLLVDAASADEFVAPEPNPELAGRAVLSAYASFAAPALFALPRDQVSIALGAMHRLVVEGLAARRGAS